VTTALTRAGLATYASPRSAPFLPERGLARSEAQPRLVPITAGLNFLGVHSRNFGKPGNWLTVPQQENVLKPGRALRSCLDAQKPTPAGQVSKARNPVRRGWVNDDRHGAATHGLPKVRQAPWQMRWSGAKRRHPDKRRTWVKAR
jgi:RNA-directed DNA polymerase